MTQPTTDAHTTHGGHGGNHPPGNGGGGGGHGGGNPPPPQTPQQQSALQWAKHILDQWGLSDLFNHLKGWVTDGIDSTTELRLRLEDTKEYKQRFAGNETRVKNGLAVLSPAQYLAMEDAYKQVVRQYDLPHGFYDDKSLTDKLIGSDVSANEFEGRVAAAAQLVHSNPESRDLYKDWYGPGDITAGLLDPNKTAQLVERRALAAQIGGAAALNGLTPSKQHAQQLAEYGTTLDQARQAYAQIGQRMTVDKSISSRFGSSLTQYDEEQATLMDSAKAQAKQALLYGEEAAQFGGHGAIDAQSLSTAANY